MGLNRNLLMGQNVDLKNIKAMMTVGGKDVTWGFQNGSYGSVSPNPLPNGILVTECHTYFGELVFRPSNIAYCTINNIKISNGSRNTALFNFLKENVGKTIPVIFHFD